MALSTRAIMYWLCTVWSTHACTVHARATWMHHSTRCSEAVVLTSQAHKHIPSLLIHVQPKITTKNYKVPIDLEIPAPKNSSVLALIKELISSVSLHEFNFASQNFAITLVKSHDSGKTTMRSNWTKRPQYQV
ncbi:hypothetical protein BDP27DRAFT_1376921 [Rhodocollybia butyracea]|uniref:Secreted protein n=1 Tax=Rhodocollybia butyracea TaxID=206335 RepID=A0A9P5P353_9AGAR|nr:hypothetical protein BDP27DRAFT_1376921 [Rhodocollybia butyracea]